MTADDLVVFRQLTGQESPPPDGARQTYVIAGRRSGKSFMTAVIATFVACFGDFKQYITVGETLAVLCLARDKEQARIVFRYVKGIVQHIPVLRSTVVAIRTDEIELSNG